VAGKLHQIFSRGSERKRAGSDAVLARLSEALFVETLRRYMADFTGIAFLASPTYVKVIPNSVAPAQSSVDFALGNDPLVPVHPPPLRIHPGNRASVQVSAALGQLLSNVPDGRRLQVGRA
jgi:hypothetical protein